MISKLVSDKYEEKFLNVKNQKSVAIKLTNQVLINAECTTFDQCSNGHLIENVLKSVLSSSTNTLLKNYCSQKNNFPKSSSKKRKLKTYSKETIHLAKS